MAKMNLTLEKLKSASFTVLRLKLTFLILILSPLWFLLFGKLLLYRIFIYYVARYLDPKLGKMVSSISNFFAAHDVYKNSYTVNVALHIVGRVDRQHLIHSFEKILRKNQTPGGHPIYLELTQKIVKKFGYTFWKDLDNFQVSDHIRYLNERNPDKEVTLDDLHEVIGRFGKTPMDSSRSPWEVFVIKNFSSKQNPSVKSAFIMRFHHCLADGYTVMNILSKLGDNGPLPLVGMPKAPYDHLKDMPTLKRRLIMVIRAVAIFFRGPYLLTGQMFSADNNEIVQTSKSNYNQIMRFYECDPIQLMELKQVKNHYKVNINTLVTTMVVGGIHAFMKKKNVCPSKIHMTFPLPVFNHADKLRNYFSGGVMPLDLRYNDRLQLLHSVEAAFLQFRHSFSLGLPEVSLLVLRFLGSLPSILVPNVETVPLSTTLMHSSIPGPVGIGYYCGFPVVDSTVGASMSKAYPIGTLCYSYNGVYKIAVTGDTCTFRTPLECQELGVAIYEEFLEFQRRMAEEKV